MLVYIHFQKIITVTFENVCRLAYEMIDSVKNALDYNVHDRFLCHILIHVCFYSGVKIKGGNGHPVPPFATALYSSGPIIHIYFYNNCRNSRAFIGLFSLSISGQYAMRQRAIADNLTICYRKKKKLTTVVCRSTAALTML